MSYLDRHPENCTQCLACELVCSFRHYGYFDRAKSRVQIIHDEEYSEIEIHQCIQCDERSCVHACPTGALSINAEYGHIMLDESKCIQCKACYRACKYNGVAWDEDRNHPLICDLCDGDPQCINPCKLHKALVLSGEPVLPVREELTKIMKEDGH